MGVNRHKIYNLLMQIPIRVNNMISNTLIINSLYGCTCISGNGNSLTMYLQKMSKLPHFSHIDAINVPRNSNPRENLKPWTGYNH